MFAPTVINMVEVPEPDPGMGLGLKLTVVPEGTPEAVRSTGLFRPPPRKREVIVDVAELPCAMVRDEGEADNVN